MKTGLRLILLLPVLLLLAAFVYWAFFDIQSIRGDELLYTLVSPDGKNTLYIYRNNGGATTDFAVLGTVRSNRFGFRRNIYWQYRRSDAVAYWVDNDTVVINGVTLDVWREYYDYRRNCRNRISP